MAFLRGFTHAFRGIWIALKSQRNLRIHAVATVFGGGLGLGLKIDPWEWCVVILSCGLVWMAELVNTSIEWLADRVTMERDESIRNIKDTAAGAVLAASMTAAAAGALVFVPRLWRLL